MKLMIILLISLLLATSVEAGNKKKCTKCTNKLEAAKKKFNKCERKGSCPLPPLRGSACVANPDPVTGDPVLGQCGTTSYPWSGLECKCFTITVGVPLPEEICTCEPKSPYLDTVCAPLAVGTCGSLEGSSGLTCQCKIFCSGCQETCTCRPAVA